ETLDVFLVETRLLQGIANGLGVIPQDRRLGLSRILCRSITDETNFLASHAFLHCLTSGHDLNFLNDLNPAPFVQIVQPLQAVQTLRPADSVRNRSPIVRSISASRP